MIPRIVTLSVERRVSHLNWEMLRSTLSMTR